MQLAFTRAVHPIVAALLFLGAAVACEERERAPQDTAGAADSVAGMSGVGAPDTTRPAHLRRHWSTMSAADLRGFLRPFPRVPGRERDTSEARECEGRESDECRLVITALRVTRAVHSDTLSVNGTVLAIVRNIGPKHESTLNLPPQSEAYVIAYLDTTRSGAPARRALLVSASDPRDTLWGPRRFAPCNPDHDHGKTGGRPHAKERGKKAGFEHCAPPAADTQKVFVSHKSPPWMTCAEGCCSSDADAIH